MTGQGGRISVTFQPSFSFGSATAASTWEELENGLVIRTSKIRPSAFLGGGVGITTATPQQTVNAGGFVGIGPEYTYEFPKWVWTPF